MSIKRIILIIPVLAIMLLGPSLAIAEDAPAYSFATAQGDSGLEVIPGSFSYGYIYFYNVDGNRTTHIAMEATEVPDGWTVEFDPPLADQQYNLGGDIIVISENLFAEVTEIFAEPIASPPAGTISLTLPKKLGGADTPDDPEDDISGYCVAKELRVKITVPGDVPKNITEWIRVLATGSWPGQTGQAQICQSRSFKFDVEVVQ